MAVSYLKRICLLLIAALVLAACNPLESKVKAGLQVETGTVTSSLFLDGQYLEKTPFINKDIKPGTYTLRIQPEDPSLVESEMTVTLRKGLLTVVTWLPGSRPELSGGVVYEMEKLDNKNHTELAIVTIPDAAIVKIANREKEFAPLTLTTVEPGEKEYEVSLPSYDSQKHTVNLVKGYKTTITVKLAKSAYEFSGVSGSTLPTSLSASTSATTSASVSGTRTLTELPPKPSPLPGSKVKIKNTGYKQNEVEGLRVRETASAGAQEIGFVPTGTEWPYLNESLDGWYKIQFEEKVGWVSSQYTQLLP